jgi:hypothetical protein
VTRYFVFNGDADGLCALQQLRLDEPGPATLVTGVKRDIALLSRVRASAGDEVTVLDVSLDVNRAGLLEALAAGAKVRYFDHHFAGEVPEDPALEAHLDPSPEVCTSLLVDRALRSRHCTWAVTGAFGDGLDEVASSLAERAGIGAEQARTLKELGVALNYNAYGDTVADLRVPPAELAERLQSFAQPLEFAATSPLFGELVNGYRDDMQRVGALTPWKRSPGALCFVLPEEAWARRASGTLANELARAHRGAAVAILSRNSQGNYTVSVRVPADAAVSADTFCRQFPTGGGRRTAAGINQLPEARREDFFSAFEEQFQSQGST